MTDRIKQFLDTASECYYAGHPIINNEQFDSLAALHNYNALGYNVNRNVSKKHFNKMYSLQKHYEDSDKNAPLSEYINNLVCSPKLDGAAISLLYIDGKLTQVLTRGDGEYGIDKTDKFLATNLVPHTINVAAGIFQVSGELVAPQHVENARNYASGALNLIDINEFKTKAISFFAYDCYPYNENLDSYTEVMSELSSFGFGTVLDSNIEEIYPTDGLVFRLDSLSLSLRLGYTSHHPKFAYALKERQDCVETTLLDVEWNTGRTGKITPVAILEPIVVDEKTVTRATLHNPLFIEGLDLCIGARVGIRLAGKIIPEVVYKA